MPISRKSPAPAIKSKPEDWLSTRRFAVVLALLVLAAFPQIVLGAQTFVYRDFGIFSYPLAQYLRECFWRGEIPLWNPLSNCGIPFLAQWNTQALYPPALFYLVFPLSWALGVFCLLHLFWGGLGMFLLARDWTKNSFAAAFAGIVFAFNGLMLNSLIWPATVAALGWMPWVVRSVEQARSGGGRKIIFAAIVGALQMLTGGTEVVLFTWIVSGVLALRALLTGKFPRHKIFWRMVMVVLLVAGLCAAQLLPFFSLLQSSRQQQQNISAATWPMPVTGLANFFVPLFHCHSSSGIFMQDGQSWTSSYYLGVAAVVLALGAVGLVAEGKIRWLTLLAGFCLVLAVGEATPVYGWLSRHVSVIGLIRFPVKFVILPVFVVPLLAARLLAKILRDGGRPRPRIWFSVWLAVAVLMLGLLGWQWHSEPPGADRTAVLVDGLVRLVFFTAMAGVWFLANKLSGFKPRLACQLFFLLLAWLDLFQQMVPSPTVNRAVYQPEIPRALAMPQAGLSRAQLPSAVRDTFYRTFLADAATDYIARRYALFANCNLLEDTPKCDGFYPLYLTDYALLFYNFYQDGQPSEPLLDFLGIAQVFSQQTNQFDWVPRTTFLPLLTAGQKPIFAGELDTLRSITNADFRPAAEVFLPAEAKASIPASNAVAASISDARYAAQKIEAEVTAASPTMVVAAQIYYHPWHAYVDGHRVPLWHANYAFQAFEIPAGSHHVKLVYEDRQFQLGAIISVVTLAGCVFGLRGGKPAKA
jgi:hypothetical protein